MASLTFENLTWEHNGVGSHVKVKLSAGNVQYKIEETGKSGHFEPSQIKNLEWIFRARGYCLVIKLKTGKRHYFDGFVENDFDKISKFVEENYQLKVEPVDISLKGWNWGLPEFDGEFMEFHVDGKRAIDLNLKDVVHASKTKNELILQFQTNDEGISLFEMRFAPTNPQNESVIDEMYEQVMREASVLETSGESLCVLEDMHCLQPRGRYEIKLYQQFIHMRGKTYDYSVPRDNFVRFYLLPHPDERQLFFVLQINPPITHGQTRYYFLVLLFDNEEARELSLTCTEEWLREQYGDSCTLTPQMAGPGYELVTRLFKTVYGQKLTVPSRFTSKQGARALSCSYRTTLGFLYPLDKGFIFVPKPTVSVRSDEVTCVNLSRASIMQRTFDFDIETKNGTFTFTGVDKSEYNGLFEFVKAKGYVMSSGENMSKREDWSASEDSPDEYLERMKQEGGSGRRHKPAKDTFQVDDDEDDEEDEDFRPPDESSGSSVAEEYDSEVESSSGDDESSDAGKKAAAPKKDGDSVGGDAASSGGGGSKEAKTKESIKKQVAKAKSEKRQQQSASSGKAPKTGKGGKAKKAKDPNAPKKPLTAFLLFSGDIRVEVARTLPAKHSVGDVAKVIGERWKTLTDAEKAKYAERYNDERRRYDEKMKAYVASGGGVAAAAAASASKISSTKSSAKHSSVRPSSSSKTASSSAAVFKSEEFVQSSGSSSED